MTTISRVLQNLSNESVEMAAEINKALIHGLHFKRDGNADSMERIKMELTDVLATIEYLNQTHGVDIMDNSYPERFNRKVSTLRMLNILEDKDLIPVPSKLFNTVVDFFQSFENFYISYPVSLINDPYNFFIGALNTKTRESREQFTGKLSDWEHAICEYFSELLKEDNRPVYYSRINLECFDLLEDSDKWDYDKLWMALALLIRRQIEMYEKGRNNEREFCEKEINRLMDIILPNEIMEVELSFKEPAKMINGELNHKLEIAILECERKNIKFDILPYFYYDPLSKKVVIGKDKIKTTYITNL